MLDNGINFLIRCVDGLLWDYRDLLTDMAIFPHLQMCINASSLQSVSCIFFFQKDYAILSIVIIVFDIV